jgi:hypothetical protein
VRFRTRHAGETGNAVVHGNDQIRFSFGGERYDFRCESVAEPETVRHQEIDVSCAQSTQPQHGECGAGCAIGIEIADDKNALVQMLRQQFRSDPDAAERIGRQQRQAGVESEFLTIPKQGHLYTFICTEAAEATVEFFQKWLQPQPPESLIKSAL